MQKFRNRPRNGFDSGKEEGRFQQLLFLQKAGKIHNLRRQVKFELIPAQYQDGRCVERAVNYYADYTYHENGKLVVEDCKGYKTEVYRIKKKLMLYRYNIRIKET